MITCAADRCTVPRKTFEALLADPAELVKQARVVPYLQDGQTRGFKLFGIPGGQYIRRDWAEERRPYHGDRRPFARRRRGCAHGVCGDQGPGRMDDRG